MKRIIKNLMLIGIAATLCIACDKGEDDDNGIAKGTFTVAQGKKVYFSQGNLQYQASTNTWRFAERQCDVVGRDYENLSSTYDGWIDLFGYGTSGWDSGANAYQPYSKNHEETDYFDGDLTGDNANADWGVYNKISNGGNKEGLWRTLTYREWYYLLFTRPHYAELHSKGRVDGIQGLILLPDDWQIPNGVKFSPKEKNWDTNDYTIAEWRKMEANGAIFLPDSKYWSSSTYQSYDNWNNSSFNRIYVYIVSTSYTDDSYQEAYNKSYRNAVCSVRLVQDVK